MIILCLKELCHDIILKILASNFQYRQGWRFRNFIQKYLWHRWVIYFCDSCNSSVDWFGVFRCRFWLVFEVKRVNFRGCSDVFVDVLMSSRGGLRTGSGRKKIHVSFAEGVKFWQRGHRRIWLDCQIYSSWVSAKIYCGYRSDSAFAGHLLSLERRRR